MYNRLKADEHQASIACGVDYFKARKYTVNLVSDSQRVDSYSLSSLTVQFD